MKRRIPEEYIVQRRSTELDLGEYGLFRAEVEYEDSDGLAVFRGTYIYGGYEFYPAYLHVQYNPEQCDNPLVAEWESYSVYPAEGCTGKRIPDWNYTYKDMSKTTFRGVPVVE